MAVSRSTYPIAIVGFMAAALMYFSFAMRTWVFTGPSSPEQSINRADITGMYGFLANGCLAFTWCLLVLSRREDAEQQRGDDHADRIAQLEAQVAALTARLRDRQS